MFEEQILEIAIKKSYSLYKNYKMNKIFKSTSCLIDSINKKYGSEVKALAFSKHPPIIKPVGSFPLTETQKKIATNTRRLLAKESKANDPH